MASNKQRHRPALIALVIVAAVACLAMAWWQLDRFESSSGTGQNLGYALQWPAFAAFFVYAYRKFVVLEDNPDEVEKMHAADKGIKEIPAGILPPRPSAAPVPTVEDGTTEGDQIAEYNRILAELAEADRIRLARLRAEATPSDNPQRSNQ
ncbi:transcriptional regulator [Williamsia sp. 1138]|uniref:SGNH/GDSL hydrolase family protein n=1 Tax=Williamsia sp. 1138 TaxID=1903117 RepID=UPI000A112861|nr:transcriptional regulator [Williamsia sp. 1138]OZG31077.1 transcriptional regulator [Williamsia sp. 1138]